MTRSGTHRSTLSSSTKRSSTFPIFVPSISVSQEGDRRLWFEPVRIHGDVMFCEFVVTSTLKRLKLFQALLLISCTGAASVNPGPASSMSWHMKQTKNLQLPQVTAVNAGRKHTSE